jgi:2-haloacid dehalogenase
MEAMAKLSQESFSQADYPDLDDIHYKILEKLLTVHGLASELDGDQKTKLNHAWHELLPWEDSSEGIGGLQKSAITATLSNGTVRLLADLAKYGSLHFDIIFSGETFLSFKPNPAMYLGAARLLKLKPEEVCMVAAHDRDLQFAKKNGLKTAFVYRSGEGHAENEISSSLPHIDVIVEDLKELSSLYSAVKLSSQIENIFGKYNKDD